MAMADHVMLKTTEGKDVTIQVTKDTKVTKDKQAMKAQDIKVGPITLCSWPSCARTREPEAMASVNGAISAVVSRPAMMFSGLVRISGPASSEYPFQEPPPPRT